MANLLPNNHNGLNLYALAEAIDALFGYPSDWSVSKDGEGSWELNGEIKIDLLDTDALCLKVGATGDDRLHVYRYVLGHEKAHHDQELKRTYTKTYEQDVRPYELDSDLVAGWVCANAVFPAEVKYEAVGKWFNDLGRLAAADSGDSSEIGKNRPDYPWPEEKEQAFLKGARCCANGRLASFNPLAAAAGIKDQTLNEFLVEVPGHVKKMWLIQVPPRS